MRFTRRGLAVPLAALIGGGVSARAAPAVGRFAPLAAALDRAEARSGGRIGLALLDTADGARYSRAGGERFPMCSTFKLALAGWLLQAADQRRLSLDEPQPVTAADMVVSHAPFAATRVGGSATLFELAKSIVTLSDNPATNILLRRLGGPAGFTQWLRSEGDRVTRLDRWETEMSEGLPGDPRDTSSPDAMLGTVERLLFGNRLSEASRRQLTSWMEASETGNAMLRAGLPAGWREGNKTGSGSLGIRNLISLVTPPGRAPLLVTIFLTCAERDSAAREKHFPPLAREIARSIGA